MARGCPREHPGQLKQTQQGEAGVPRFLGPGKRSDQRQIDVPSWSRGLAGVGGDLCSKKWQELALHVSQAERATSQLTKDSSEQVRLLHSISFPPTLLSCAKDPDPAGRGRKKEPARGGAWVRGEREAGGEQAQGGDQI